MELVQVDGMETHLSRSKLWKLGQLLAPGSSWGHTAGVLGNSRNGGQDAGSGCSWAGGCGAQVPWGQQGVHQEVGQDGLRQRGGRVAEHPRGGGAANRGSAPGGCILLYSAPKVPQELGAVPWGAPLWVYQGEPHQGELSLSILCTLRLGGLCLAC